MGENSFCDYPVKYAVFNVNGSNSIYGPYVVSKCFLIKSVTEYGHNANGKMGRTQYYVFFPYIDFLEFKRSGTLKKGYVNFDGNGRIASNGIKLPNVFDLVDKALSYADICNNNYVCNAIENGMTSDEIVSELELSKQFEAAVEEATTNMKVTTTDDIDVGMGGY